MRLYRGHRHLPSIPRRKMCRFLLTMGAVFSIYMLVAGDSGFYQLWYRKSRISALQQELDHLRAENTRLEKELVLLNEDLGLIERIARERYGMVKANESVYMVYPYPPETVVEGGK